MICSCMDTKSAGTSSVSQVTWISNVYSADATLQACLNMSSSASPDCQSWVQAWGFSVPRVLARTLARWSPSKAPSSRAPYIRSSWSGVFQARAGPLQAIAVPAPQTNSIVPPLPLETPRTACTHPFNGTDRKISLLPTATLQGERVAAPLAQVWAGLCIQFCATFQHVFDSCPTCAQDHCAINHQHQLPDGSTLELLEMRPFARRVTTAAQPPLLFLHGASHGAWCWAVS